MKAAYWFAHLSLMALVLMPLALADHITDNDQYTINTAAERTVNVTQNSTTSSYFPTINNDCAGNPCYYTWAEFLYEMPDSYIRKYDPRWYVKHGTYDAYNISVPKAFNTTHFKVRMIASYHSSGGYDLFSLVQYHNGTDWVIIGQNDSATPGAMTNTATTEGVLYDGNYASGAYGTSAGNWYYDGKVSPNNEGTIYDNNLYWPTGILIDVIFNVRDEYGKAIEGATVTATRIEDNFSLPSEDTDLSGKVRLELGDDQPYTINVTAPGYTNFSGVVHILETSYTITLTSSQYTGTVYESIFQNITWVTSPSENPDAALTNFTMNISDGLGSLDEYGIYSTFNGTFYEVNGTNPNGSYLNLTIDLTGFAGSSITVDYWFKRNGTTPRYTRELYFYIGGVNASNSSLGGVAVEFLTGMSEFGRAMLGTAIIMCLVIMAILAGIPPSFASALAIPAFIVGGVLGFFDPVISVIVALIMAGVVLLSNRGGLA